MSPLLLLTLAVSALYLWSAWRLRSAPAALSVYTVLPLALLAHGGLLYHAVLGQGGDFGLPLWSLWRALFDRLYGAPAYA